MLRPDSEEQLSQALFTAENLKNPHELWKRMRRERPILRAPLQGTNKFIYIVSRRADIEYICANPEIYSNTHDPAIYRWGHLGPEFDPVFENGGFRLPLTLVNRDPPISLFYRKVIVEALNPGAVRARRPALQRMIDGLLDELPIDEDVDFKNRFAVPLPVAAISEVLGLAPSDKDFILTLTDEVIKLVDPITPLPEALEAARGLVRGQQFLAPKVLACRDAPTDSLISAIANTRDESGDLISMEEALSMIFTIVVAGNETTRNSIMYAAHLLATNPDLWSALKTSPELAPAFVEEAVRQASPAAATPRRATRDTTLSGIDIPVGSSLFVLWASANYDETAIDNPEQIRLDRDRVRQHMSFGHGVHHCAGIHLARAEIELTILSLLRRYRSIRLPENFSAEFDTTFHVRQLTELQLIFEN